MLAKAVLALAVVGTVSAASATRPVVPRWISADKHGYGYLLNSYWNGTYNYEGSTSFSWDFDYNCARSYFYSYTDYSWAEASYCNNYVNAYHSLYGCESYYAGYYSLEQETNKWLDDFTISWGSGFTDPVWGYDNYHVLEHKSEWTYIYMRPSDKAIEFIVDSNYGDSDVVVYYPSGLTVDNTTYGVWDYDLRYGYCANNNTYSFAKNFFSPRSFSAKPAHSKPANLAAKPKPESFAKVGGVKALFQNKNAQPKSLLNAPEKATFLLNKEQLATKSPLGLFLNAKPVAAAAKPETKVKSFFQQAAAAAKPASFKATDDKFQKFKSFVSTLQGQNLATDSKLSQEVDQVFALVDANRDGLITQEELRAAALAQGEVITEEEMKFVYFLIDANLDGKISWNELYNFGKSQSQTLYTRSEKVNMIFQVYDTNQNGYLSKAEIKRLLVDAYGYATDADAEWFVAIVDANLDGKISWTELYNVIE